MKKLIIIPFLVFGQFITNAQTPTQKAQQTITLKLIPTGRVHLPKTKDNNGKGKDKNQLAGENIELSQDKNIITSTQVIETVVDDKNNAAKNKSVVYTVTTL